MKKRILIVDDDSSVRSSLQNILEGADYEVSSFPDGESAENDFKKSDLLILDLNLPVQDGWDVLGHVNSAYPLLPVIVITGLADQLDERTIPGAAAFLEKPIEVPTLMLTIERLLSQTPDQRMEEASRSSEPWQLSMGRAGHPERKPKNGIRRFRYP